MTSTAPGRPWLPVPGAAHRRKVTAWTGAAVLGMAALVFLFFLGSPSDPGPGGDQEALSALQRNLFAAVVVLAALAVVWLVAWLSSARRSDSRVTFAAPPGWPQPTADWRPTRSWQPDPARPAAPVGWQYWDVA